jgi:hypothetical protein
LGLGNSLVSLFPPPPLSLPLFLPPSSLYRSFVMGEYMVNCIAKENHTDYRDTNF